ncbi:putative holin-like toxin [Bacillus marinisedimentorum]
MTVYQTLVLMISFATLILAVAGFNQKK